MSRKPEPRYWLKTVDGKTYLISTQPDLLSTSFINSAFSMEEMYWAKPIDDADSMDLLINNSCSLGLYILDRTSAPPSAPPFTSDDVTQVGISRLITDHVTFAYLTDVFILPQHQGCGLGRWLIACTKELVLDMPYLRRFVLMTGCGPQSRTIPLYEKELGMRVQVPGDDNLVVMLRKKDAYPAESESG